jgi:hypothetical protein
MLKPGYLFPSTVMIQKNINYRGFMYDTVQSAADIVVRIDLSFQRVALNSNRGFFL